MLPRTLTTHRMLHSPTALHAGLDALPALRATLPDLTPVACAHPPIQNSLQLALPPKAVRRPGDARSADKITHHGADAPSSLEG